MIRGVGEVVLHHSGHAVLELRQCGHLLRQVSGGESFFQGEPNAAFSQAGSRSAAQGRSATESFAPEPPDRSILDLSINSYSTTLTAVCSLLPGTVALGAPTRALTRNERGCPSMLHRVAIALAAITLADGQAPVSCTFKTPTGSSVRCAHARASFFLPSDW